MEDSTLGSSEQPDVIPCPRFERHLPSMECPLCRDTNQGVLCQGCGAFVAQQDASKHECPEYEG